MAEDVHYKPLCLHNQIVRAENAVADINRMTRGFMVTDAGRFHDELDPWQQRALERRREWHQQWVQYGYTLREQMYPRYRDSNTPQTEEGRTEDDEIRAQRATLGA